MHGLLELLGFTSWACVPLESGLDAKWQGSLNSPTQTITKIIAEKKEGFRTLWLFPLRNKKKARARRKCISIGDTLKTKPYRT